MADDADVYRAKVRQANELFLNIKDVDLPQFFFRIHERNPDLCIAVLEEFLKQMRDAI